MTNLDSVLKSRDITLPTKVHLVKAMVFPVVMYGCESWTVKKAEHQKIDAFELSCWRRHLRVPWTARRSNQSILKEINPLGVHWKDWFWSWNFNIFWSSRLRREYQFSSVTQSCSTHCDSMDCSMPGLPVHYQLPEPLKLSSIELVMDRKPGVLQSMGSQRVGYDWATKLNIPLSRYTLFVYLSIS